MMIKCDTCRRDFSEDDLVFITQGKFCTSCHEMYIENKVPPLTEKGNRKPVAAGVPLAILRKHEKGFIRNYNIEMSVAKLGIKYGVRGKKNVAEFIQVLIKEGKIVAR